MIDTAVESGLPSGDFPALRCIECGASYSGRTQDFRCGCGGLLDAVHDLAGCKPETLRAAFEARLRHLTGIEHSGVWRYSELVYPGAVASAVTALEGNTTLYTASRVSAWAGVAGLALKHEGENPTGSFKDRGMTVGITHAVAVGARAVACASTGNTSASMAAYASRAGLKAIVFIPYGSVALGKLSQSIAYGARTVQVRGDFDAAMRIVAEITAGEGIYILNSVNPFRLEGQKTIVFEMLHQLGWEPPDWIVVPGGNLGNTSAFGKALYEARALGLIAKLPRLAVIQASGSNPFFRAYERGFDRLEPVKADTLATAIKIGDPVNYSKAKRSIEWTAGVVAQVTDAEILDAKAVVDAAGIGCEPASAASVAGVRKLAAAGVIHSADRVVAILTGHLLKDPDSTINYHFGRAGAEPGALANEPIVVEPDVKQILKVI